MIGWSARGFFKTEKGPDDDVGSSAGDLHQLIETLGLERFHLIGCAAGGCTAISYALNHPERLHSLILSGTILLPDEAAYKEFRGNLDAAPPTVNTNIPVDFREVGASYRAGSPDLYEEWRSLGARAHPNGWYLTQPWGAERNFKRFAANARADIAANRRHRHEFAAIADAALYAAFPELRTARPERSRPCLLLGAAEGLQCQCSGVRRPQRGDGATARAGGGIFRADRRRRSAILQSIWISVITREADKLSVILQKQHVKSATAQRRGNSSPAFQVQR